MTTDIRSLDPSDPGYDAAVEAALREEDEADGLVETGADAGDAAAQEASDGETAETGQEPAAQDAGAAQEPAEEASASTEVAASDGGADSVATSGAPASGVQGKDGKVLPYAVLKGARDEARQQRQPSGRTPNCRRRSTSLRRPKAAPTTCASVRRKAC